MLKQISATAASLAMCFLLGSGVHAAPVQWDVGSGGNGHFYDVVSVGGGISWTDARDAAALSGGYLATSTSAAENGFIFSVANDASFWVGSGLDSAQLGPWLGGFQPNPLSAPGAGWEWLNGEGAFAYTNWSGGEPNDSRGPESYLHLFCTPNCRSGLWNDVANTPPTGANQIIAYVVEFDTLTAVPLPAALPLFGTGLGLMGLLGWWRRRKAVAI